MITQDRKLTFIPIPGPLKLMKKIFFVLGKVRVARTVETLFPRADNFFLDWFIFFSSSAFAGTSILSPENEKAMKEREKDRQRGKSGPKPNNVEPSTIYRPVHLSLITVVPCTKKLEEVVF